jgi:1,2-diacylglycerol 3-alpha-glucosyltransferase
MFLTRLTVKNVDRAVTVSKYCQRELRRQTGLESEVVYNTVDLGKFRPGLDGTEIRKKYNLGDDPVILFVGVLRPVKGVDRLIEAFCLVKEEIPNAKLVVVGPPDYAYYFEELKRMSDNSITFTNFVSHEFLPLYYATCDVYATGTLWETFNIPIAEAQACAKPVVAFDIGPHPEVIDENGILVEAGDIGKFAQACIEKLKEVRGNLVKA